MTKKVLLVLVLAVIVAGGLSAQSLGGKKNFASVDLGLIAGGLRYERAISPKLSVGGDVYWASSFILWNELELGAFARYYPGTFSGPLKNLYLEAGFGYHTHTGTEEYTEEWGHYKYTYTGLVLNTGVAISPGVGVKFAPGKAGDFFVEPGLIIPITIGKKNLGVSGVGLSLGFVLYCGLGWAF
jgi:hypothetical protein